MVEYVDIVDENDGVIDSVPYGEMRKKNLMHRCSHILVFNNKGELLVTKRTETKKTHPGLLELGAGGALTSGETYEQNALRELGEECGIKNVALRFLFKYPYEDNQTRVITNLYSCTYDGKIIIQKEEVAGYFWVSIPKLKEMINKQPERFSPQAIDMLNRYLEYKKK